MLRSLLATAFIVLASLAGAVSAQAAFTVTNYGLTPSTLQAAGHPKLTFRVNPDATAGDKNGDDLKSVAIDFPAGLLVNPEAVSATNNCTATNFNADKCPAASQVGTISVQYRRSGSYFTSSGSVYKLTPDATNIVSFGFIVRPSGYRKLFLKSSKVTGLGSVRTGIDADYGLTATVDSIPRTLTLTTGWTINITISDITVAVNPRSGSTQAGPYVTFNPTRCNAATSRATFTSYLGVVLTRTSSFAPTGCTSVPFTPTASVTPSTLVAGAPTGISAQLAIPTADKTIQQSHVKDVQVTLPEGTSLNMPNIGAVAALCTDAQLASDTCPAGSKIGAASAAVPFLPPTMTGDIYLMMRSTSITFGIVLRGSRATVAMVKGSAAVVDLDGNGTPDAVRASLLNMPQIPYSLASMTFTSQLVNNPASGCGAPKTAVTTLNSYSGKSVSISSNFTLTNCPVVPETTITSPPPIASDTTPTFTFTSDVPTATFQCSLDGAPFTAFCTSPYTTVPLADGSHTFAVRAVNGPVLDLTPASQTFTITAPPAFAQTLSGSVSTTQAAAHPDVTAQIDIVGSDDVKSITVNQPFGLQGSSAAVPLCSPANPASCTAASAIGTQAVTATLDNGSSATLVGTVFLTTPANAAAAASLWIIFPGLMAVPGDIQEFNNGNQQRLVIPNIPNMLGGTTHIHITRIVTNFFGSTGAPSHPFLTNPSSCSRVSAFTSSATSYGGLSSVSAPMYYVASGCATVPFSPTVTQEFSNPVAGGTTGVKSTITLPLTYPQGNSAINSVRVTEPPVLAPNYAAFGDAADQCPSSAAPTPSSLFDPSGCPAQSKVGHMTVNTLLLPVPLEGDVYLINKSPLPWFGIQLRTNGVDIRLVGAVSLPQVDPLCDTATEPSGFCQQQIQVTFANQPDQPLTNIVLDLNGPARTGVNGPLSGDILKIADAGDPTCVSPAAAQYAVSPITGTPTVNSTQAIDIAGCVIPDTTITSPAPDPADNTPTFTFASDVAAATFECSLDGAAFSACTSPLTTALLPDGSHTFAVRAIDGNSVDPTPASQTFTISTFVATTIGSVSTTQAAAHPDITQQIDIAGSGDVKSVTVTTPFGLQGSAAAVPQCSPANPASCTAASVIGTQAVTATLDNGASSTLVGNVFLTTPANAAASASLWIIFPGYMAIPGDFQEFNNGNQQRMVIPNVPNMLGGTTHIHVTRIVTTFFGSAGAPTHPFLTNPSSCTRVSAFIDSLTSWSGQSSVTAPSYYRASGCDVVPFTPTVTQEFSNPVAGGTTGVKTTVTQAQTYPIGNSSINSVRVTEPPILGPNYPSFGETADQCPSSAAPLPSSLFDPSGCPAQSKVGHMTVNTLLLPLPLEGDVYLINKSPLPWFGVHLTANGIDIRLVGVVGLPQVDPLCDTATEPSGFCQQQIQVTFSNQPDQPLTNIVLDLNGPDRAGVISTLSGNILTVASPGDSTCVSPATAQYAVSPITGTPTVNSDQAIGFSGC